MHTDAFAVSASEHRMLLERCGLVDRSERGKLALSGSEAVDFLNGQVTNDVSRLHPGEGCYAAFLTHKGKMLGDLRILAVGERPGAPVSELLLDTERVALQALFDMIGRFKIGYAVELHKRTLQCALLALIGPRCEQVLAEALDGSLTLAEDEHSHAPCLLGGVAARAVRSRFGIDLLCAATDRERLWQTLLRSGAEAVGERAAEVLRVERGVPRYGLDIDETTIPQEADLNERAVSFTKGCYVGQETVARLFYKGKPNRHLRGLRLSQPVASGAPLSLDGRPVGTLGSAVGSPTFGYIGLALVRREAQPGSIVAVGQGDATAQVVTLPFSE